MDRLRTTSWKPFPFSGLWLSLFIFAYHMGFTQTVLDDYVEAGLKNNVVLQQKKISYAQAENALRIAKSYFLPSVSLLADYTSGRGGRNISLPLGDLLNPVYRSLNALTEGNAFPDVPNVSQDFFPYNFYDVRLRTSVPLLNTDLIQRRKIQGLAVVMQQHEVDMYKRQLIFEIKAAYYHYLAARASIEIHENAVALVEKNVKISEALLRNGKALPSALHRLRSEREKAKAELTAATSTANNAATYFNFLLNRDPAEAIALSFSIEPDQLQEALPQTTRAREEVKMMATALEIQETTLMMEQLKRLPKVNAFVDVGSQDVNWEYDGDSRYYLVGIQLSIPLFHGSRTNRNIRQHELEIQKTQLKFEDTKSQMVVAVTVARNELSATIQNFAAARKQLKSAESYFHLMVNGYREGVESLLSFLDARNHLIISRLHLNLRTFELMIAYAKVERETASYPLIN